MRFDIITIFPKIFDSYLNESLFKRAREKKLIDVRVHNLRDFVDVKHNKVRREARRTVDDRPFGGGPGMVLKVEPIWKAVEKLRSREAKKSGSRSKTRVILFSTRGKKFDAKAAKRLSKYDRLIFICGRYEGVDERVAEHIADEEISMGDYVLSGGELPAIVVTEAMSRFIFGFLGKEESLEEVNGSFPTYTRPGIFYPPKKLPSLIRANRRIREHRKVSLSNRKRGWSVPTVLLSGNHKKIGEWRKQAR